jgi:hypothetical protein
MFHAKKFSIVPFISHKTQGSDQVSNVGSALGGSNVTNPINPGGSGKQRLRWTSDLHDRFVDAITQLGGPDSGYFCYFSVSIAAILIDICSVPVVIIFEISCVSIIIIIFEICCHTIFKHLTPEVKQ